MQSSLKNKEQIESLRRPLSVMIVTGEASGDVHAAGLLTAIKQRYPNVSAFGMGSTHLQKAGMEVLVDSAVHGSVMGLTDVIAAFGGILSAFRTLVRQGKQRRPDILILLDFPDFNMRLAKALKPFVGDIVYFIAPQVWAWRTGRVAALRRDCSKIIPIFPFEEDFYKKHGVDARWLGHPFLDHAKPVTPREEFLGKLGLDSAKPLLAMLPGSRKAEVERLAESMCGAWQQISAQRPGIQAIVPVAHSLDMQWVKKLFAHPDIVFVHEDARTVLSAADVAIVASGTATLEAAICNTPFVIVYKLSNLTYRIGKAVVKGTKFIGMPNIIAGKQVAKEFVQESCTPGNIASEVEKILSDSSYRQNICNELLEVSKALHYSGDNADSSTVDRVADEILSLVSKKD